MRILVIDDSTLDQKIARDVLSHAGFEVTTAADGGAGLRAFYEIHPHIVVLDVLMPGMDGWTVCQRVRELSDVPIIMLTALNREEEMVRGLELGADDFVAKPISPRHLIARVRAVLRRVQQPHSEQPEVRYDDGVLVIDVAEHRVCLNNTPVERTPTEFRLLAALARTPNRVHAYASLLTEVWGSEYRDDVDFLRVYIWRLRKKLEADPEHPRWLQTERGFGYRFAAGPQERSARR